jgi:hypothetical protein
MSFIDASVWNDQYFQGATNEKRFAELGLIDMVKDSTPFVDYVPPSAKEALRTFSSLRNAKIPVIKDQAVTVNTTPGFEFIPANLPESALYSFTAVDVFSGFRHTPAAYENNVIDEKWAGQQVAKNVAFAMGNQIETLLAVELENRKTQLLGHTTPVSQGDGTFSFDTTPDKLNVNKAAQKETMFHNLETLMAANELGGNYRLATSRAGLAVQRAEAAKYGAANEKNLKGLGFFDESRLYESGNISAGSDIFNGWLMRDGAMGVFENFPYDFRNGTEIGGKKWSISDSPIPFTGMRANLYVNKEATKATSLVTAGEDSNLIMTHWEEMAIWIRFYIVYRYNSDLTTRANDIVKITGLTT